MHMRQETKTAEKSLLPTLISKYKNLKLDVIFYCTMNLDICPDSRFLYFGTEGVQSLISAHTFHTFI